MASNLVSTLPDEVKMKGTVGITCECSKKTADQLKWLKINNEGEIQLNDNFVGNEHKLELTDVTLDGKEAYACAYGNARVECSFRAEVPDIKFNKCLENLKVTENQELSLNCKFELQSGSVVWSKDSKPITQGNRVHYSAKENKYQLVLKNITEEDAGEYRCVYNGVQTTFTIIFENPKEKRSDPKMTFTFICDVVRPECQIKWMKNSEELKSGGRIMFSSDMPAPWLDIRNVKKGDEGSYSCVYCNAVTKCNIEVEELPKFTKFLDDRTAKEKDPLTLNCKLSKPALSVTWFKDDREIKSNRRVTISSENGQHNLKIKDTSKGDAGNYRCECKDYKAIGTSCTIKVEELPTFTKVLDDDTAKEKETLTLNCELSRPAISVKWFKDGKEIKNDGRIKISSENGQRNLKIKDVSKDDAGNYRCECKDNKEIGTNCTINVEELPTFTKFLDDDTAKEKETLILNCKLSRPAISVKWFKDGKEIKNDGRVTISSENRQHSLKIKDVSKDDAGNYRCECKDNKEIGTNCTINVEELPTFTKFLDDDTAKEKDTLILNCELSRPAISVKWFKDGKEIKNDGRVTISSENRQHSLKIKDVSKDDAGNYRCECKDYKEIDTSCIIRVKDTPAAWMKSPIFVLVCSVVLNVIITYTGILGGTSSAKPYQSREVNDLVYRMDDIDKAVSYVKQQQKTDKKSFSEMLEEYKVKVLEKDKTEFKSISNKIEEVKRNIFTKAEEKDLEDTKRNFENTLEKMKENFAERVEAMQGQFSARLENLSEFTGEFNRTLSEYKTTFEKFENETNKKITEFNTLLTNLSSTVEHDLKGMLENVKDQVRGIEKAKQKADDLLGGLQGDVNRIIPNTFNKEALTMAFMVLIIFVFMLALWIYKVQNSLTGSGPELNRDMNAKDVLQRIPRRVALSSSICIISFDEARKDAHEALIRSAVPSVGNIKTEYFVVRRHEHLLKLPKCKFYIMCTEFSERHVIIEEPGLGLGDLKRCTYETIQRYGAEMIILYTRDPGSRNLGDQLYNPKIHCVSAQPELSGLRDQGRFFSTYDELSATQKKTLNNAVVKCLQ